MHAENGPWLLSLSMPSYLPVMQYCKNRNIRETLYRQFVTRASTGEQDNAPIIKRILQLKLEMSQMLGYQNHAEKSLASKMAENVQDVNNLTEMLHEKAYPAAVQELADLKAFAKVCLSLRLKGLCLYTVDFLFHVDCCIRQLAIILFYHILEFHQHNTLASYSYLPSFQNIKIYIYVSTSRGRASQRKWHYGTCRTGAKGCARRST